MKIPGFIRKRPKTSIAVAIILVLLGLGISAANRPKQPEYVTAPVQKGDLRQTVEAVGTIVSERELELRFAGVGIVSTVNVKEGDRIFAGQRLAQLRSGSLGASIASQAASYQQALADLHTLEQGSRPEDIAIAEADLAGKRASLQVAKSNLETAERTLKSSQDHLKTLQQETDINLSGQVSTSMSALSEQLVVADSALSTIDDVLTKVDVQDAIVKDRPGADQGIRTQARSAKIALDAARSKALTVNDYQAAIKALADGRVAVTGVTSSLDGLFSLISSLPETNNFSSTVREGYKTTIITQRSRAQDAASTLTTQLSTLQNASASYDSKIAAEQSTIVTAQGSRDRAEADIQTYQAAINSSEAQLALKRAGARPTDIEAARARVRAAQANLARAQADFSDTVLIAPISGTITHVNIKTGESLPAGAAITLLGDSPFRVEMFVSEIDIPKVQLSQSGSIELDAFRGTNFKLHVGEVDTASTDKDGVSKYRVKLDFNYPHNELKIGMTGDAEITTGMRSSVLSVPRRAVLDKPDGSTYVRILKADNTLEERPVTMGMEGGSGDVEILSGVQEGETIVVLVKQ